MKTCKHFVKRLRRHDFCQCGALAPAGSQDLQGYISPIWGEAPAGPIRPSLKVHGGWCPLRNHVCQVSNWNLHGLQFYRGSNFRFSYWF